MSSNKIIVFTGPSGVGKATVGRELFKDKSLHIQLACSATTRKKRDDEIDGVHYHFISEDDFLQRIKNDHFLEWSEHLSHKYGTLKTEIVRILDEGDCPFLEVETKGAINIFKQYKSEDIITIFLAPPSFADLEKRIRNRGQESESQIKQRLTKAKEELSYKKQFQHVIVNDNLEQTVSKMRDILRDK